MSAEDFQDDPDAGVEPFDGEDEEAAVEPLEPVDEDAALEELEEEWEEEEAYGGEA